MHIILVSKHANKDIDLGKGNFKGTVTTRECQLGAVVGLFRV
jgi:hypothetical protein